MTQALRLGLLAGQVLERSDNPATIRRKGQPLRVGLSKPSANRRVNTQINPNHQSSLPQHKPLGLVFWQGRRWSEATTLPRCATHSNPLGLVFQIIRISAYNQAIIAGFVGSAEMLTFAYARARSVLGYIIHLLNLYHND